MVKLSKIKNENRKLKLSDSLKKKLKSTSVFQSSFLNKLKKIASSKLRSRNVTNIIISTALLLVVITGFFEASYRSELSGTLIYSKNSCEARFVGILEEIEENPLNDLIGDKLPTAEEIFFAEWANDWFPRIDIPIVGSIIEEFGAKKVGDIDFDGISPHADLNITAHSNPSNLSLKQCEALWDQKDPYSFLIRWPVLWQNALENDQESINLLRIHFNLTYTQFDLISTWLNTSSTSWMSNIKASVLGIPPISILMALSILAIGVFAFDYVYQRRNKILDKISVRLEKRKAAKMRKAEQKRIEEEKRKKEGERLSVKKSLPPKSPISAVTPQTPRAGVVPKSGEKIPLPFKSSIPQEKHKTTLLKCPKCGGQRVVYSIQTKLSSNSAVLKVTCPIDKQNLVVNLPLETIDQWLAEVADQIYRCRICGQQVPQPEKIVSKDPWVVLFIKCPTHGLKAPKRYVFSTLYPKIKEAFEKRAAPSSESEINKPGGDEN